MGSENSKSDVVEVPITETVPGEELRCSGETRQGATCTRNVPKEGSEDSSGDITQQKSLEENPFRNRMYSDLGEEKMNKKINDFQKQRDEIALIDPGLYEFPFENLVLEGGGAKGAAYVGCLRAFDDVGVEFKRYAGASAGAIAATLYAIGYSADDLEEFLCISLSDLMLDHKCGACSLIPNLFQDYGWNPGNVFNQMMGEKIAEKCHGNPDFTFKQLYEMNGRELCIIVTNVNMMTVEYFHPKTTPNTPIRLAAKMSVSIPAIMASVNTEDEYGRKTSYIDGGLLCNYPIHAFDGWWLSMEPDDSFLNKLQPLSQIYKKMEKSERFGIYNEKTIGVLVYSASEQEILQNDLENRVGVRINKRPSTKLHRQRKEALENKIRATAEHQVFMDAAERFLKVLNECNRRKAPRTIPAPGGGVQQKYDDVIDKEELKMACAEAIRNWVEGPASNGSKIQTDNNNVTDDCCGEPSPDDNMALYPSCLEILFGYGTSVDEIFDGLDRNGNGQISYDELLRFIENSGISIQTKFQGYARKDVNNLKDFVIGVQDCLLNNVKRLFMNDEDFKRTIGVNTDYIETTDFTMETEDRKFLIERGYASTESFLRHHVHDRHPPLKPLDQADSKSKSRVITTQPLGLGLALNGVPPDAPKRYKKLAPIRGSKVSSSDDADL